MPWLISLAVTGAMAVGRFLWKRKALTATAVTAGALGYDVGSAGAGKPPSGPSGGGSIAWIIGLVAALGAGGFFIIKAMKGKSKKSEDNDFYAGALGLPIEQAAKVSADYLRGQLSAKRQEAKWGNPGEILGMRPTAVHATYGGGGFGFNKFGGQ